MEMLHYPWENPPEGFITIDRNAAGTLGAGLGEYLLEQISFTGNYSGWIRWAGIFSSNYAASFYTIKQGNQPMRDYTRIGAPLGQADSMDPLYIQIRPNEPVGLYITRTAAGVVGYRYRLLGWYFPVPPGGL